MPMYDFCLLFPAHSQYIHTFAFNIYILEHLTYMVLLIYCVQVIRGDRLSAFIHIKLSRINIDLYKTYLECNILFVFQEFVFFYVIETNNYFFIN